MYIHILINCYMYIHNNKYYIYTCSLIYISLYYVVKSKLCPHSIKTEKVYVFIIFSHLIHSYNKKNFI